MRVLVLGGSGLLGSALLRRTVDRGDRAFGAYLRERAPIGGVDWHRVDLRDRAGTAASIRAIAPDLIINAAFRQSEWATTADGAANAASATAEIGARLLFVSSDAVFSGQGSPYVESATPDPITPYGAAKAAAETAVRALTPTAVIVRTSLIIGRGGASGHERRAHAAVRGEGHLFTDDIRCPVDVVDLAAAMLELAATGASGVHHLAGPEPISRYDLGRLIARRDGLDPDGIRPGKRSELAMPGPLDVRLDSAATQRLVRTKLRGPSVFLATRGDRP
ncbi:sugar nucleotide-binding protein [Occultella kanbiaonis]|uniref:sugar nucleotide-binding protein n=1 Tax=Occultella kanbiaonis TaxID=2675754 RepID=UPI0013D506AC|nr:sugar nucleotide-binding protein [Occultella kanbiaonis]